MSDFKSNEYPKLIAGQYFEPVEENPMLGCFKRISDVGVREKSSTLLSDKVGGILV